MQQYYPTTLREKCSWASQVFKVSEKMTSSIIDKTYMRGFPARGHFSSKPSHSSLRAEGEDSKTSRRVEERTHDLICVQFIRYLRHR